MKKRYLYGAGVIVLTVLVALVVAQGSFSIDLFGPPHPSQTTLLWAVSSLIFVLMVTLGFMLVRDGLKLYMDRRANREGSGIRSRLVGGAVALTILPVFFLVLFSVEVLNLNLNKWFSFPTETALRNLTEVSLSFENEVRRLAGAQAALLAKDERIVRFALTGIRPPDLGPNLCTESAIETVTIQRAGLPDLPVCTTAPEADGSVRPKRFLASSEFPGGIVTVAVRMPVDLAAKQQTINEQAAHYSTLYAQRKDMRRHYFLLMALITLFVLFVATWLALLYAKRIAEPIAALFEAAGQLRRGHLDHRVKTRAIDELVPLVRAFNEMAAEIEASEKELERRHNFTEAILENIPTGVISLSPERRIQRTNRALQGIFGDARVGAASVLEDLFAPEQVKEIGYLLNRARRTGEASSQLEVEIGRAKVHLAVTVSALAGSASGWVMVLEDMSELLRAQKLAAWQEVARRIAHEMKNPLTPISLSAERIGRQLDRVGATGQIAGADAIRILRECCRTISGEVESVKTLVDEFSQFARFPSPQPVSSDLNEIVESGLSVFNGRLNGVEIRKSLAHDLPPVMVDRDQFKRVIVNLVDNAAEAMEDSPLKCLTISTQAAGGDTVELTIADTGHGIAPEDRERLFLPYFSTKSRGTGLGLAIVQHILSDHGARVRVEDGQPQGARFLIEIPAVSVAPAAAGAASEQAQGATATA